MTPTWLQWQGIIEVIIFDSTDSLIIYNTKFAIIKHCIQKVFYYHVYLTLQICADMDKGEDPLASSGEEMDSSAPVAAKKDRTRDVATGSTGSSSQSIRPSSTSSRNSSVGGPLPSTSASNPNCISNLSLQIRKIKNAAAAPRVLGSHDTIRAKNYGSLHGDTTVDNRSQLAHLRELYATRS